jgi:hypothetical protein
MKNNKVIVTTSDNLKKLGKELYDASVIISDNKIYKNHIGLSNDVVLDWVINHPGRIEEYIELKDDMIEERRISNNIELGDVSFEDLKSEVKIDITGLCASGKSNIALLIYDTLKLHGVKTNINDYDIEYEDIDMMRSKRIEIFNNLSERSGVSIETKQAQKKLSINND